MLTGNIVPPKSEPSMFSIPCKSLFELIGTTDKQDYTSLLFNIYEDEDYYTIEASFDDDAYVEINSVTYNEYIDKAIIGTFFMNDLGILVTISYRNPQYVYGTCIGNQFPKLDYTLNLYNENLEPIKPINKIKMSPAAV